jgi:hypothetical protein
MVKNVSTQPERNTAQRLDARNLTSSPAAQESDKDLSLTERELLQEVLRALRVIRYGSVVLTVHDGNVVEIQKIERIRKASGKQT